MKNDMQLVTALITVAFACVQRLFQIASKMNHELERAQSIAIGARIVFQNADGGRKPLNDAGPLIVQIFAIDGDIVGRMVNVDINEVPSIRALSFGREFVIIGPV